MLDRTAFERAVQNERSEVRRLVIAAGLISRAAANAGVSPVIVSGGTAAALITQHDFGTRDIDIITPRGDELGVVLEGLGFARRFPHARIWKSAATDLIVESPASELPRHSDVDTAVTPTGDAVSIWSVTDPIVDRVAQAAAQGGDQRLMQALALRSAAGDQYETVRARERAEDDGVRVELRAFEHLVAVLESRELSAAEAVQIFRDHRP